MPTIPYTDWQLEASYVVAIPWAEGRDDNVDLDFTLKLAAGETIAAASAELWRLPAIGEDDAALLGSATSAGVTTASYLPAATVIDGVVVRQRVAGLARGRVYRLRFWIGPAGNRRDQSVIIDVARA